MIENSNRNPFKEAHLARQEGNTRTQFPGTFPGNRLELSAGYGHELPASTEHSNSSKAMIAARHIAKLELGAKEN